jgi:hypothetical protein
MMVGGSWSLLGCVNRDSRVSGFGVVEEHVDLKFVGTVVRDRSSRKVYDISHLPARVRAPGSVVEFEGRVELEVNPASGVPPKMAISKFEVLGKQE